MHDDQRSSADDVFAVVFVIGALLCMALYALVVYVIIPLLIFAAVVGVIGLIIAGLVCYVRSHAWLFGGFLMLLLNGVALALGVYTTMLAYTSLTGGNATSAALGTGLLLLLTLVCIALVRPVVRRRDAEAECAELQQQLQHERLESERKARLEEEERRKREEIREEEQTFDPGELWRSTAPIPRGLQVAVHIAGTYSYLKSSGNGVYHYADAVYTWLSDTNPGNYKLHHSLFFDDSAEPATPFWEERPSHTYRFLYIGTGTHMAVFLRRHPSFSYYGHQDHHLTLTIGPLSPADQEFFRAEQEAEEQRKADERRREEEEAAAKREREAEKLERRRRTRLRTLEARYSKADLAWRADDTARQRYAQEHREDLLRRRKEIIDAFEAFHADTDFIETLRTTGADWYGTIDEVFYFEMVSIAENLPREPVRDKTPPTPDERREQELSWSRVKSKDYREQVRLRLSEERDFIEDLRQGYPNLTEQELQQELQRFRDEALEMPSSRRNTDRAPGGSNGPSQGRVL